MTAYEIQTNRIKHRIVHCADCGVKMRAVRADKRYCYSCARRRQKGIAAPAEALPVPTRRKVRVQGGYVLVDWLNHNNNLTPEEEEAYEGSACATCWMLRRCQVLVAEGRAVGCER